MVGGEYALEAVKGATDDAQVQSMLLHGQVGDDALWSLQSV
jgi:hypothetical protein